MRDATDGEDAPTKPLNTHLAFGDAQTVAMLDLAAGAYKESRVLHRTEMSCPPTLNRPILAISGKPSIGHF